MCFLLCAVFESEGFYKVSAFTKTAAILRKVLKLLEPVPARARSSHSFIFKRLYGLYIIRPAYNSTATNQIALPSRNVTTTSQIAHSSQNSTAANQIALPSRNAPVSNHALVSKR